VLLAALGFGLVAGASEAVAAGVRSIVLGQSLYMGPELIWGLPLADGLLFLGVGLLWVGVSLLWKRLRAPTVVVAWFAALAAFAVLLLSERIHVAAEALLAAGVGVGVARALAPWVDRLRRMLRVAVPAALLFLGVIGVGQWGLRRIQERRADAQLSAAKPGSPNILLLVLDTVRAWNMGLYGYGRPTTPKLNGWASRGALFERALSGAPWTTLSHAVMFTGRYPTELSVDWRTPYDGAYPTLADVLHDAGYLTAGFAGNYLNVGRGTGLGRGFVHYEDYPLRPIPFFRRTALLLRLLSIDRVGEFIGRRRMIQEVPAATLNARFLSWLDGRSGRPWFGFVNYFEAHGPYLPPSPYDTMFLGQGSPGVEQFWRKLQAAFSPLPAPLAALVENYDGYDGAIAYLDGQVDALLRALADRGQLDNTIVVVTSDHGELFGEHQMYGHGNNLYLPVLHVPLLVIAPGRVAAGARVSAPASLRDLPATLLGLAGVPNPGVPGHPLLGVLGGGVESSLVDTLLAAVDYHRLIPKWPPSPVLRGSMRSIVLDSLQYILNGDGGEELYHLGRDSWEVHDLARVPAYQAELARYRAALRVIPGRPGAAAVPGGVSAR
jgi:arylsulfatase A-like enzyme